MRINKRKLKRNLAVSTVVANMLMILITLSLAAILVAWAGTTYGAFSGGSSLFFQQRGQALQERYVVEQVFFNKTTNSIMIFVRNVGSIEVHLVAIYVNGSSHPPEAFNSGGWLCTLPGSDNGLLPVQSVCEFNMNVSPWQPGDIITVVVASARGNQVTTTVRAP
jgi:TRAP-type mannitol/chloroaromatic compound transport system permease large subunit